MSDFYKQCGGRVISEWPTQMSLMDGGPQINFGMLPEKARFNLLHQSKPTFHQSFPHLANKWTGQTVNHWLAVKKVLGDKADSLKQYQVRGSCGGRAGAACGDFVQCIMIASGQWPAESFKRVSHAAVYFLARKLGGMLEGNWQDDNTDGVAPGSVQEALARLSGFVQRDEIGDDNYYGQGSDDLACKLGAGLLPDLAKRIIEYGGDNKLAYYPVQSAQELADGLLAGGMGLGCDSQGFKDQRDADGICAPYGRWDHYHIRFGVGEVGSRRRRGFDYFQSWDDLSPTGLTFPDLPSNSFKVDWATMEKQIRTGKWCVVTGFQPWQPVDIFNFDWIF